MLATTQIPLLDLKEQYSQIRQEILQALIGVADSQQFILGHEVSKLEEEIASYCGVADAIGCASGTDALYLALLALEIGPGDEVITSPYTFFATAGAIVRAGATAVFADIDEASYNLDPDAVARVAAAHSRVKAIIPVHLFGGCADMDPLAGLAEANGIHLIEDAAQAIGSEYKGRRAGSMSRIACFSFFPTKNLGAYGDAGMLTTADAELANRLRLLRVHGGKTKYHHDIVGINSRIDALQAAVLRVKLRHLDSWIEGRQRNADLYRALLVRSAPKVVLPGPGPGAMRHTWHHFVIRAERRDELKVWLAEHGVGTEVYYPVPLHLQPCFASLGYRNGDFPAAEALAASALALPVYPELGAKEIRYVCEAIARFYD
jgi:dTDP-4-amino-4,6-dideoxygalactose transaminase